MTQALVVLELEVWLGEPVTYLHTATGRRLSTTGNTSIGSYIPTSRTEHFLLLITVSAASRLKSQLDILVNTKTYTTSWPVLLPLSLENEDDPPGSHGQSGAR